MTITQEHDTWFRETGQFLEPAGQISSPELLDLLRRHSQSVREELEHENKEAIEKAVEQEKEECESQADEDGKEFKKAILLILDDCEEENDAMKEIRKLCEH